VKTFAFIAIAGLTGLSCASQSAATTGQASEQQASSSSPAASPDQPHVQGPAADPGGPAQVPWAQMTKQQRGQYMASVVMPRMKEVFQAFDAQKFATFNCKTCHGQDAKDRGFKMPNPGIFALPATQEGWGSLAQEKPEWMQFMGGKVKPMMAALLDMPEYDPKNPQPNTLGCNTCHTVKSP
jgi:hypothetical protein